MINGILKTIAPPKCGSEYLSRVVKRNRVLRPYDDGEQFVVFVTRHPLDRLVSTWAFFCVSEARPKHQFRKYLQDPGDLESDWLTWEQFQAKFIEKKDYEAHLRPQNFNFRDAEHIDYFIPLDELNNHLLTLQEGFPEVNFDLDIVSRHVSKRDKDWRNYIDEDSQFYREAMRFYKTDWVLYNTSKNQNFTLAETIDRWRLRNRT